MIVLKQLKWSNCFSYGNNNVVDFSKNTITQVLGENGHGKSSIVLILQEILYGKNSKGIKKADILNRNQSGNKYDIELILEVNGIEYRIWHSRVGAKVALSLFSKDDDLSEHTTTGTYKKIEQLLGLSFEDFCQLVYQSSDSSLEFLKATDTTRKKFLISLLNLDYYSALETKCKSVLTAVNSEKVKSQSAITTVETWLNKLDLSLLEERPYKEIPPDPENLRENLAALKALKKDTDSLANLVTKNNSNKAKREKLEQILANPPSDSTYFIDNMKEEISELKAYLKNEIAQRNELKRVTDTCPTCKQKIAGIDINIIKDALEALDVNIAKDEKYLADLQALLVRAEAHKVKVEAYQKAKQEYDSLVVDPNLPDKVEDGLDTSIANLTAELECKLAAIEAARSYNTKTEIHNAKIASIKQQKQEYELQVAVEKEKLSKVVEREARLEVLKTVFSTKGLVAYKIENMIKDLEDMINQYLLEFSNGRFTLEFTVTNDKLNVEITDEGKPVSIVALSSGELARVNTSTLLAIRKLLNSLSNAKLNLLFLDEVLNVLDEDGRQKLISVLSEEEDLNSFIVSHGWYHPLVSRLRVFKERGISTIKED